MEVKVGKYMTENGRKAIVRYIETETAQYAVGCIVGVAHSYNWNMDGSSRLMKCFDLVVEGWPLELKPGWYMDNNEIHWQLIALPKGYQYPFIALHSAGYINPYGPTIITEVDSSGRFNAKEVKGRYLVESCEPPRWIRY